MIICEVIGKVWATRKEESLNGMKLMIVRRMDIKTEQEYESFVAVDCVGAGVGEPVLVVIGSSAREAFKNPNTPVDAAIVGIIDGSES